MVDKQSVRRIPWVLGFILGLAAPGSLVLAHTVPLLPQETADSSSVLAVVGEVFQRDGVSHWPDGDRIRVVNLRTSVGLGSVIGGVERSRYAVVFLDTATNCAAVVGDTLVFHPPRMGVQPEFPKHVVTEADLVSRYVQVDIIVDAVTEAVDESLPEEGFRLRIQPNPLLGWTSPVLFWVGHEGDALSTGGRLLLFDVAGRMVRSFGIHSSGGGVAMVYWDGRDAGGRLVDSGSYHAMLVWGNGEPALSRRVMIIR